MNRQNFKTWQLTTIREICVVPQNIAQKYFFLPSYIREGLDCIRGCIFSFFGDYFWKCTDKPSIVKPVLTTTSEQRPPVNNNRLESPALLNLQWIYLVFWITLWTMATIWTTGTFWGSQGWPLYTGLIVFVMSNLTKKYIFEENTFLVLLTQDCFPRWCCSW